RQRARRPDARRRQGVLHGEGLLHRRPDVRGLPALRETAEAGQGAGLDRARLRARREPEESYELHEVPRRGGEAGAGCGQRRARAVLSAHGLPALAVVGISLLTLVPGVVGGSETYARELCRALDRVGELEYRAFVPTIAA